MQQADASGRVAFTTIFPGCYSGRWPHNVFSDDSGLELATITGDVGSGLRAALSVAVTS